MVNESTSSSDGLGIDLNHLRTEHVGHGHVAALLEELAHHGASFVAPAATVGRSFAEDLKLTYLLNRHGKPVLTHESLQRGHMPGRNPLVVEHRDKDGNLVNLLYEHNCRTNNGGRWQGMAMAGGVAGAIAYENHSGAVTYTATTVTPTASPTWTVGSATVFGAGWNGKIVVAPLTTGAAPTLVYANIISNTATALTIDQWTTFGGGVAASTPAANVSFAIFDGASPARWLALSTDTTTEDIGDTSLASEFTNNFTVAGRWYGTKVVTGDTSGTGTTNSSLILTLATGVLTANGTVTVAKAAIFCAQSGSAPLFERKFGTAASVISGDTLATTWTETNS